MSERMAYICVEPCGCVSAATVDDAAYAHDNAKVVAEWMRDGATVERIPVEEARGRLTLNYPCEHELERRRVERDRVSADQLTMESA